MKKYEVIEKFINRLNPKEVYKVGDIIEFDETDDAERIEELLNHPTHKRAFIKALDEEFPKHIGGGTYELSNGEKVKGKDDAIKAEEELK